MFVTKKINNFITVPTMKKARRVNAVCSRKILEVELNDGSMRYYWSNHYNLSKLTHFLGSKINVKK